MDRLRVMEVVFGGEQYDYEVKNEEILRRAEAKWRVTDKLVTRKYSQDGRGAMAKSSAGSHQGTEVRMSVRRWWEKEVLV